MRLRERAVAEFIGTFWLVFGGCGTTVGTMYRSLFGEAKDLYVTDNVDRGTGRLQAAGDCLTLAPNYVRRMRWITAATNHFYRQVIDFI